MTDEKDTLRDDILSAADEVEDEVEESPAQKTAQETETEVPAERDAEKDPIEQVLTDESGTDPELPDETQVIKDGPKAPVDWPDEVKAAWDELPDGVRQQVAKREQQINETLRETSDIRHDYDDFNRMINPFIPIMQAEGLEPMQAIEGLMKTTAALQLGSPQQKAQRIAGLIQHYGIDIETLDMVLSGQQVTDPGEQKFNELLDQRLAPVNELLTRVQQAENESQNTLQNEAANDLTAFANDANNVFFEQVRYVMADFLDLAASRNQPMTLDEAYRRACLADPDVAPQYTRSYTQNNASTQGMAGKRAAASSISGSAPSSPVDESLSLRETLAQAFGGNDRI